MAQEAAEDLYKVIGIDFGTTSVSACVFADNQCKVVTDAETGRLISSVIRFDQRVLFGEKARTSTISPLYVSDIKSMIGLKQIPEEVINGIKGCSVTKDDRGKSMIQFDNPLPGFEESPYPSIYPEFLLALIMRYVALQGSLIANLRMESTVISVPPSFSLKQIHVMKTAASLANLRVSRIVTDPQAIMTMMLSQTPDVECKCVVYDLGGGDFHLSYLEKDRNHLTLIDSEKVSGLSGAVIDKTFAEYLRQMTGSQEDLIDEAERVKMDLSANERATLSINSFEVTRDQFYDACEPVFEKIVNALKAFIDKHNFKFEGEDKLVIVGGNSQMMTIYEMILSEFPKGIILQSPDQLVANGCLVVAMDMIQETSSFNNVLPCSLYYSANQKGAYHLFDKFTPLSKCEKMVSHIPKLLSSTNRLYVFDNSDSYIGYFDIPTNIEESDYLCCFSISDDFEIKLDIVNGEHRKICSCSLQYYDEVEESDMKTFSLVSEFTSQLRRIIACFSRPEFGSDPNVATLLGIMDQYYDQESSFRLYPSQDMTENLNTVMKEFSDLYYEYYNNEL